MADPWTVSANATIDDNSDSTPVQTSRLSNRAHENLKQTTVLATGRISSPPLTTSPSTIQPVSHDYTITRGSQVSPLGMPRTLRRQPGHLAAKPDDPRHGARNNHGHSQSQDQRPNPLSPVSDTLVESPIPLTSADHPIVAKTIPSLTGGRTTRILVRPIDACGT
jgi:hypothetical protein